MRIHRTKFYFMIMVFLFAYMPGVVHARYDIAPYLSFTGEYTDNLFLTKLNKQNDWISTVQPGFALAFDHKSLDVEIDYSLRFRYYNNNTDENETDIRDVQRSSAHAVLFPGRDFTVATDIEISRVAVDERGPDVDESERLNATNRYRYNVKPQYSWSHASGFMTTISYLYDASDYESSAGDDTLDHKYSLLVAKQLTSQTNIYAEYVYVDHLSDDYRDFQEDDYSLGLRQLLGARLTLNLHGGLVQRDTEGTQGVDENQEEWQTWGGKIEYLFSELIRFTASYDDELNVSVSRGQIKQKSAELRVLYEGRLTAEAGAYWSRNEYLEEQAVDRFQGVDVDVKVPLGTRYYGKVFGKAKRSRYKPTTEEAYRYTIGTSLGYSFNWLDVSTGYSFRDKDSNIDTNDYQENRVTLQANLRY